MGMHEIIKTALFTPLPRGWGLPVLFWGKPGVAKSDIIEGFGRRYGFPTEVLSPGERGEGAFGVTPVPVGKGRNCVITYPKPDWVCTFEDEEGASEGAEPGGLLFLDEINTQPSLFPAQMGLIQARRIGGAYLGRRVRILGAANPPECSAGGFPLPAPVANRLCHLNWRNPSVDEWGEWLISHDGLSLEEPERESATSEEARVLRRWPKEFAISRGIIRAFIRSNSDKLHRMPDAGHPDASKAWCSHRTWAMSAAALASAKIQKLTDEDTLTLVAGFVGDGAAIELAAYIEEADLPDPEDVLTGKVDWHHDPRRLDRTAAVLGSCTSYVLALAEGHKDAPFKKKAARMYQILGEVADGASDLVVSSIKPLSRARLTQVVPEAIKVLAKLRPVLDAAGYTQGS